MYPYNISVVCMRERGYDPQTIEAAELADKLCKQIEDAFAGVELGCGVSLREARARDDQEDDATCARQRSKDEKNDWRKISSNDLNQFNDTPSSQG